MTLDREQVARVRRRQEALDSLAFEREREAALVARLEPVLRDAEAWRTDEAVLALLDPEDAATLGEIGFVVKQPPEDARARFEARIAELGAQIEDSQRRQRAFAAYARALEP